MLSILTPKQILLANDVFRRHDPVGRKALMGHSYSSTLKKLYVASVHIMDTVSCCIDFAALHPDVLISIFVNLKVHLLPLLCVSSTCARELERYYPVPV